MNAGPLVKPPATVEDDGRRRQASLAGAVAAGVMLFPAAIVVLSVAGLALGRPVTAWPLAPAAVAALIACWWASDRPVPVRVAATVVLFYAVALVVAAVSFDGSFDGLWYHQEAALRLADGWNPIYEGSDRFGAGAYTVWFDHYPKAAWIASAAVFRGVGRIEAAKLFHLPLMAAAACQVASLLLRSTRLPAGWAWGLAILAAANPVAIYQSTSNYLDGLLASSLVIALGALAQASMTRERQPLVAGLSALVFLVNLKFTGLVYAALLCGGVLGGLWWARGTRRAMPLAAGLAAAGLAAVFVIGYAPYVRNLQEEGTLFYPVISAEGLNPQMMANNLPSNVAPLNRFARFAATSFAYSDGVYPPPPARLKVPFRFDRAELEAWRYYDVRIGGFGPFYGGLLVLAAILAGAVMLDRPTRPAVLGVAAAIAILLSAFVHTEGWWARYAPQAWLAPFAAAVAALLSSRRAIRSTAAVLLFVAAVDVAMVAASYAYHQYQYARQVRASLAAMRAAPAPVTVSFGRFTSLRQRLREAGVGHVAITGPPPAGVVAHPIPTIDPNMAFWYR